MARDDNTPAQVTDAVRPTARIDPDHERTRVPGRGEDGVGGGGPTRGVASKFETLLAAVGPETRRHIVKLRLHGADPFATERGTAEMASFASAQDTGLPRAGPEE